MTTNYQKAIFWIIICKVSFYAFVSLIKLLPLSSFHLLFIRSLVVVGCIAPIALRDPLFFRPQQPRLQLFRVFFGSLTIGSYFLIFKYMDAVKATAIISTKAFILPTLAIFFLNEKVKLEKWVAIILGYFGVLITVGVQTFPSLYESIALCAGIFSSITAICAKRLTTSTPIPNLMVYSSITTILWLSIYFSIENDWPVFTFWSQAFLGSIAVGLLALLGQFAYLKSIKYVDVSIIAPFDFLKFPLSLLVSLVFLEIPSWTTLLGAAIIISSLFMVSKKK